jgi:uncharacterized protein
VLLLLTDMAGAIAPTEVKKRRAFVNANFFHFTDKDGVITGDVGLHNRAVEIGQGMGQDRGPAFHLVVMYAEAAGGVRIALGIGKKLGERFLLFLQNAHAEASAFAQVQIGFGKVIDAHQRQRRPQGHRTERTRRHAVHVTFRGLDGDHRHSGTESSQSGAKFLRCDFNGAAHSICTADANGESRERLRRAGHLPRPLYSTCDLGPKLRSLVRLEAKVWYDTRWPRSRAIESPTVMNHSGTFATARSPEEVFDLLADPQRFAPLLPDFESMLAQDAAHFSVRITIAVAQINGHANLAMELREAVRPGRVEYRGQGIVAGSQLNLNLQFDITSSGEATAVNWRGEFSLDGMLAVMAGHLLAPMGRRNFELMAGRIQNGLRETSLDDPPPVPGPPA